MLLRSLEPTFYRSRSLLGVAASANGVSVDPNFHFLKLNKVEIDALGRQEALGTRYIFSTAGPPLYDTHVPTATWQKAVIAASSALTALANPARADLVAALGETTGVQAYGRMLQRMKVDREGRAILAERPRVTSAAVGHAWDLPENTFGAAYAQFMGRRNFSADDRPPVRFVDNPDLAYVAARAREVHDFWHVLFGCRTTVSGELALKMVELVQTGLPMCALAVAGGPFRLPLQQRTALRDTYYPWAVRAGQRAADLMCIYYERAFEEDLEEVRRRWRITPAPKTGEGML